MDSRFGCRVRLGPVVSILIGLWLGIGPFLASSALWESEPDCCCGSDSACLLGGCGCGGQETREASPCGGLRSADDFGGTVTILSFGLYPGLAPAGIFESRAETTGQAAMDDNSLPEPVVRSIEPPPPRVASAR